MEAFEVLCSLPLVKYRDMVLLLISAIKINSGAVAVSDPVQGQKLPHGFTSSARARGFFFVIRHKNVS